VKKRLTSGFVLLASLMASQGTLHPHQHITSNLSYIKDPRYVRLKHFLNRRESPLENLTADFIAAADRNQLDWRLLPAIATLESSAGKRYMNNNVFGWDSCKVRFPSIRKGIHHVAGRLSESDLYRDKDLDGILRTYNPYASYPGRIKRIMRNLGPAIPDHAPSLD
jgi:hypothetical protein